MSDTSPSNACPKCGAALPSAATSGLCPRCLMAEAMLPTQADAPSSSAKMLTSAELAPHFPQLEILECLGRGGMGVVYKARQRTLNRFVALKLLAPERVTDAKFAERFTHEAQALAALNHPSIVTIYDFGQAGGFYFLLMEFVDGVNLRQAMKAGRFTPEQALNAEFEAAMMELLKLDRDRGSMKPASSFTPSFTPNKSSGVLSEKTQKIVDALLPNIGQVVIALEHNPQEQPNRHSLELCAKDGQQDRQGPNFYLRPRVTGDQMKKLLLRLAADGYFDHASGGPLPPKSSESPPLPAKNQPGYVFHVFSPERPQDSNHYAFHEDLSLQEGAAFVAAMKLYWILDGKARKSMDTILGEIKEQAAVRITKEQVTQVEALLKKGPVTTNYLAAIFEHDETSGHSYRQRADVVAIPILPAEKSTPDSTPQEVLRQTIPLGEVLHQIGETTFYVQWDEVFSSSHHYYGPYYIPGEVATALGMKLTKGKLGAMNFGPEIERVVSMTEVIDLDTGKVTPNLLPEEGPITITDNSEKDDVADKARMRKRGVDAIAAGSQQLWGLDLKLKLMPNGSWDITPEQLAAALNFDVNVPAPESVIRGAMPAPATFAFQTREGAMGLLSNEGPVGDNSGVKNHKPHIQWPTSNQTTHS